MPALQCSARTCVYNKGELCSKGDIKVGGGGATRADVRLFKEHIGAGVKIKAAGGIRTMQDAEAFLRLGCDRLGTSSIVKMVKEAERAGLKL